MSYMKSISKVQKLWPKLKFIATERQTDTHTDRQDKKLDAPEFHSGGIKMSQRLKIH